MFQACLIAITFLPPPPLTVHKRVMSSVGSVKVSVCVIWKRIRRGETWWVDLCVKWDDEKKEEPSSFINPSTRSRTVLISSVFHLTVHIPVCVCNAACVGGRVTEIHLENKSTFGMFHSILKHAEHRTLNTYTEQLVLSKCSFSFFCLFFFYLFFFLSFFPVQSDFRIHRTRRKPIAPGWTYCFKPPNFVYMSCMPHRWYYVYTKITPTPITVYHSNYRKKLSVFFAMKFNWETLYIYVFISNTHIHTNIY